MIKYIIFFILLTINNLSALTVQQVSDSIRLLIKDNNADTSKYRITATEMVDLINIASLDIAKKSHCLEGREYLTASTDTFEYTVSTQTIETYRVGFQNQSGSTSTFTTLEKTTQDELDSTKDWEKQPSGYPEKYFIRNNQIFLYPKPSATYNGYKIRHDFYKKPNVVTISSTTLPLDAMQHLEVYHPLIIWYVVAFIRSRVSGELQNEKFYKMYLDEMSILLTDINKFRLNTK